MKNTSLAIFGISLLLCTSCTPRLVGTWNIARYETEVNGGQHVSLSNIGTIRFNKNGTGEKKLNFSVLGITKADTTNFKWNKTESSVTITGTQTDLSKVWLIIKDKKKLQTWKATDGSNLIQVLELEKQ